jgi:hypothetical protein
MGYPKRGCFAFSGTVFCQLFYFIIAKIVQQVAYGVDALTLQCA